MKRALVLFGSFAAALLASGCTSVSSTARRAGLTTLGTAAGAAAGYGLSGHDPQVTALAAIGAAAATQMVLGEDPAVRQAGFDQGYVQGQSDAIKRQYFLRQALESRPLPRSASEEGETVYYAVPGPEVTVDGRRLAPHRVTVRVTE